MPVFVLCSLKAEVDLFFGRFRCFQRLRDSVTGKEAAGDCLQVGPKGAGAVFAEHIGGADVGGEIRMVSPVVIEQGDYPDRFCDHTRCIIPEILSFDFASVLHLNCTQISDPMKGRCYV